MTPVPKSRVQLDSEFDRLEAKVARWYSQMSKCRLYSKVEKLKAKILRATNKAAAIKHQIAELRRGS